MQAAAGGPRRRGRGERVAARRREVREELGIDVAPGRLLAVDYREPRPGRADALRFAFDGGELSGARLASVKLNDGELSEFRFAGPAGLGRV